jgi:SAM-dependent methyltransferase
MEPALPKARFLDPRREEEAASAPIAEAANLPWDRLRELRHELPPPGEPVLVARVGPEAERAVAELARLGYEASLSDDWTHAPMPMRWRLWEPNPLLNPPPTPPGTALDLGCGAGRDAVWLAAHGWRVTGVDLLPEAIGRARCLAERFGVSAATEWVVADLRRPERLPPGPCDLMLALLCRHWRLAIALADRLGPGGRLVLEAFGAGVRRPGVTATPKEVVQAAEAAGLRPERVDTGERRGAATVRAVLRRC